MNFGNHEPHETVQVREKYKWVLLVFLFVAFFLELGSRQLYNAALPQIRLEFLRLGVTDAQLGKPTAVLIAIAFGFFMYASLGIRLWMPMFLTRSFDGVGTASAAFHGVFWLNAGSLASCLVTARLIDRFGAGRPRIRLEVSLLGFLLCIGPMLWVARAGSFPMCCLAMAGLGMTIGVYEAAHYPAMFDCIEPRYRSAATGITGCMAFLMGSLAPAVLGWMNDHMSMRSGFASLGWFYLAGALVLLPALVWLFKRDYIADGEPQGGGR